MTVVDVELFAGPGGFSEGRKLAGHDDVPTLAIEWEPWACRTAAAAGHPRVRADVATFPTAHLRGRVRTLAGGPPCPTFSAAGKGAGRVALGLFVWAIGRMLVGDDVRDQVLARHAEMIGQPRLDLDGRTRHSDGRGLRRASDFDALVAVAHRDAAEAALVLEPARWIHDTEPQAVVLEQVPAVLPIWQAMARELRARGWSAWAGILNAADYGVPQTRRRAILIASRVRKFAPPPATHAERPAEDLFGDQLQQWVPMAQALGWGMSHRPYYSLAAGTKHGGADSEMVGGSGARNGLRREQADGRWVIATRGDSGREQDEFSPERPSRAIPGKSDSWELRIGTSVNATRRPADEPAGTLFFDHQSNDVSWVVRTGQNSRQAGGETELYERGIERSAPTVTSQTRSWTVDRPATTIAGDARVWPPPGHRVNGDDRRRMGTEAADDAYGDRAGTDAVRITTDEAATLQGFPDEYPWQGNRTRIFEQIGNAVPPPLAGACWTAALGAGQREAVAS